MVRQVGIQWTNPSYNYVQPIPHATIHIQSSTHRVTHKGNTNTHRKHKGSQTESPPPFSSSSSLTFLSSSVRLSNLDAELACLAQQEKKQEQHRQQQQHDESAMIRQLHRQEVFTHREDITDIGAALEMGKEYQQLHRLYYNSSQTEKNKNKKSREDRATQTDKRIRRRADTEKNKDKATTTTTTTATTTTRQQPEDQKKQQPLRKRQREAAVMQSILASQAAAASSSTASIKQEAVPFSTSSVSMSADTIHQQQKELRPFSSLLPSQSSPLPIRSSLSHRSRPGWKSWRRGPGSETNYTISMPLHAHERKDRAPVASLSRGVVPSSAVSSSVLTLKPVQWREVLVDDRPLGKARTRHRMVETPLQQQRRQQRKKAARDNLMMRALAEPPLYPNDHLDIDRQVRREEQREEKEAERKQGRATASHTSRAARPYPDIQTGLFAPSSLYSDPFVHPVHQHERHQQQHQQLYRQVSFEHPRGIHTPKPRADVSVDGASSARLLSSRNKAALRSSASAVSSRQRPPTQPLSTTHDSSTSATAAQLAATVSSYSKQLERDLHALNGFELEQRRQSSSAADDRHRYYQLCKITAKQQEIQHKQQELNKLKQRIQQIEQDEYRQQQEHPPPVSASLPSHRQISKRHIHSATEKTVQRTNPPRSSSPVQSHLSRASNRAVNPSTHTTLQQAVDFLSNPSVASLHTESTNRTQADASPKSANSSPTSSLPLPLSRRELEMSIETDIKQMIQLMKQRRTTQQQQQQQQESANSQVLPIHPEVAKSSESPTSESATHHVHRHRSIDDPHLRVLAQIRSSGDQIHQRIQQMRAG